MNTKGTNHQFWKLKLIASISFLLLFSVQLKASKNHTTIIISLDGFRWDYTYIYNTPMLDFMANHGIESGLIPSFPSKTFPNHYTLAT
jgi:alkaline phosphatase D